MVFSKLLISNLWLNDLDLKLKKGFLAVLNILVLTSCESKSSSNSFSASLFIDAYNEPAYLALDCIFFAESRRLDLILGLIYREFCVVLFYVL